MQQERRYFLELASLFLSGAPLNIFGLGAGKILQEYATYYVIVGGGCGVGLGLGWGFGAAYGSWYYSPGLTFQGVEFANKHGEE